MIASAARASAVLEFWFGAPGSPGYGQYRKAWFIKDADFDARIQERFAEDTDKAAAGAYDAWQADPATAVALLLLLDQFPRNLFRGTPRSFATDGKALAIAQKLVEHDAEKTLVPIQRLFVYLPFEHSENLAHQNRCIALMEDLVQSVSGESAALQKALKSALDYAYRHRAVIKQFGRFPHRNEILGCESTPAELAFLQQPGSRF